MEPHAESPPPPPAGGPRPAPRRSGGRHAAPDDEDEDYPAPSTTRFGSVADAGSRSDRAGSRRSRAESRRAGFRRAASHGAGSRSDRAGSPSAGTYSARSHGDPVGSGGARAAARPVTPSTEVVTGSEASDARSSGTVYGRARSGPSDWDDRAGHHAYPGGYDDEDDHRDGTVRSRHAVDDYDYDDHDDGYPHDRPDDRWEHRESTYRSRQYGRRHARHAVDDEYDEYDDYRDDDYDREDWDDERDWDDYGGQRGSRYADRDRKPARKPVDVGDAVRAGVRGFGEVLITFGMVVLLFAGYEVWGKAAQVDAAQNALDSKIEDAWGGTDAVKPEPLPGDAIARLYIPKLDLHWVVVQGVTPKDIKNAPGHYPESAMPGDKGNFAVAGHRAKRIFWDLDLLKPGDKIFVEDATNWYEYRVSESKIVLPNAVEVVAPVPGKPGVKPKEEFLTLTTCNPKWDNYERLIIHAKLAGEPRPKTDGKPLELADS